MWVLVVQSVKLTLSGSRVVDMGDKGHSLLLIKMLKPDVSHEIFPKQGTKGQGTYQLFIGSSYA